MATLTQQRSSTKPSARLLLRVAGAGLLGATGGIHFYLYNDGYKDIPHIGPLFLVNGALGVLLALAVLTAPGRLGALVAAAGALFELGTLGGLLLAVTHGIFGFQDTSGAPLFWPAIIVESVGAVVLIALLWRSRGR